MKQISSVDLYYLVKEFSVLENSRVDSFYFDDEVFYIRCYVRGKGHLYLINKVSKYIYVGDAKAESPHPNNFVSYLRKYLKNSFIASIEQIGSERILKITFDVKEGEELKKYYMYLELFANGNIVLCDENNVIKNSLQKKKFKDRDVMVHNEYSFPPARDLSISNFDEKILKKELEESDLSIVKFIAIKFGTGGKFAEEICFRLGIDKNSDTKNVDLKKLVLVLNEIRNESTLGCVLKDGDEIKDFFPFEFKSVKGLEKIGTFNEVVKSYFEQFKEEIDKREREYELGLKKLQNRLSKQEDQLKEIGVEYEILNGYGNKIYENYSMVEELLNSINAAGKEKGWKHVKEIIKSDERLSKIVKSITPSSNEIILDLD